MDKESLIEDIDKYLSIRNIAVKRGVSYSTVRYWLSKHNLKTKSRDEYWDVDQLKYLCSTEDSLHKVIIGMGKSPTSSSYKVVRRLLDEHKIAPPEYSQKAKISVDLSNYFIKGVRRTNQRSKKLLIEFYGFTDKCSSCGVGNFWNNKPLTLQLDHIDGDNLNNLVSNLRILCPNCHTQTPTYCRNKVS